MIIAFHGVTCVGKTTIGKIIADQLRYNFFDLDAEMISYYNDTIENIQRGCLGDGYDEKKARALKNILKKCGDTAVIAVSPIYYAVKYKIMFRDYSVFSIVLHDAPENIVNRLVFTDENDVVIENPVRNRKEELSDIKYFISRYKNAFGRIEHHYKIAGKAAVDAANDIINTIIAPQMIKLSDEYYSKH